MMDCFYSARLVKKGEGINFKTAIEAYDYLIKNDYEGTISITNSSFDERVKFCRWVNGKRCDNKTFTLIPSMINSEQEMEIMK